MTATAATTSTAAIVDVLAALRDDNYRLGSCAIIPYDPARTDIFGPYFLYEQLYNGCVSSRPHTRYGTLPDSFCGMRDLSPAAICSYLHTRRITLCTVDNPAASTGFDVVGFGYPTVFVGAQPGTLGERSMVGAYVFFRPWWGTPEIQVLAMLGLAYFFNTYQVSAVHGQRYTSNTLTARFMSQFGFRDQGILPRFLGHYNGTLRDCALSTLLREDFTRYVADQLLTLV